MNPKGSSDTLLWYHAGYADWRDFRPGRRQQPLYLSAWSDHVQATELFFKRPPNRAFLCRDQQRDAWFFPVCGTRTQRPLPSGFAKIAEIDPTDTVAEVVQIGLLAGAIRWGYNRQGRRRLGDLPVQTSAIASISRLASGGWNDPSQVPNSRRDLPPFDSPRFGSCLMTGESNARFILGSRRIEEIGRSSSPSRLLPMPKQNALRSERDQSCEGR